MSSRMVGVRHDRLVVLDVAQRQYQVKCDCGAIKWIKAGNLYKTSSCGCLLLEALAARATHGFTKGTKYKLRPAEYTIWGNMIQRCTNPKRAEYRSYGGRGIRVCERWRSFENFFADMGPRPSSKHSIDRYPDNDGNYEPGNVRWATPKEQGRNKRTNVLVPIGGDVFVKSEAAEIAGISAVTLHDRLKRGWTGDKAIAIMPKPRPALALKVGSRYGCLEIVAEVGRYFKNSAHICYRVRCDCGNENVKKGTHLAGGRIAWCAQSCRLRLEHFRTERARRTRVVKICNKEGCNKTVLARDLCSAHYHYARKHGEFEFDTITVAQ